MAADPKTDGQTYEVQDEGEVDTKIKKRIIDARNRVDESEEYLYVNAPVEDNLNANAVQQDLYWGMMVKQFLRTIEPILRSEELDDSERYYEDVELGEITLVPRDTDGIPFEQYVRTDMPAVTFRTRFPVADYAELPEPETETFDGLKSVIDSPGVVSKTWTVPHEDGGVIEVTDEQAVPKQIYETALREADEFLQQAGIGIEIDSETVGYT